MLTEMMVRLGKVVRDSEWQTKERIELLTDVNSENCKNFYQHVFIVETDGDIFSTLLAQVGDFGEKDKFIVNRELNTSFPIVYPHGGNPLKAQGVYPIPYYLLYDPHIKMMAQPQEFVREYLLPRLNSTVAYSGFSPESLETLAEQIAKSLLDLSNQVIREEKQLGILVIADSRLGLHTYHSDRLNHDDWLFMNESSLYPGKFLHVSGSKALEYIIEAKCQEAATLGMEKDAISTITNEHADIVVSAYNKSWLWLSPTWDMPKSIYWKDSEWTKGIKMDRGSYEAFLYGTQFLKKITVPIHSAILKEMFAQIMNAEAKSHMKMTSFEQVYGAPIILPILDRSYQQMFDMLLQLVEDKQDMKSSDLHLKIVEEFEADLDIESLSGIAKKINIPEATQDHFRLTILYYSGDLSRGNMHIRAVVEDVVPSVARKIAKIIRRLERIEYADIQTFVGLNPEKTSTYEQNRIGTLPALLSNAYGPGYMWTSLQQTLHRQPLGLDRLILTTAIRLNELANKRNYWAMRQELAFYYSFIAFYRAYSKSVLDQRKGVNGVNEWRRITECYHRGEIEESMLHSTEVLGFVSGLLLRQFENSYHNKTGKEFVGHRVMRFGSRLTPDMIWKDGVLRCVELEKQWKIKLGKSFYDAMPVLLQGFSYANSNKLLAAESHLFINGFWSGYLTYKNPKSDNTSEVHEEVQNHVHTQQ